jgi:anthranilate synthase component 2
VPILGVCLGHQAIGQAYGGKVVHAKTLMHGKTSPIRHSGRGVFRGLPSPFTATRYHSLAVERESLPGSLEVTAWTEDGEIMGLIHREVRVEGVQFHPESILTEHGHTLLGNFLT